MDIDGDGVLLCPMCCLVKWSDIGDRSTIHWLLLPVLEGLEIVKLKLILSEYLVKIIKLYIRYPRCWFYGVFVEILVIHINTSEALSVAKFHHYRVHWRLIWCFARCERFCFVWHGQFCVVRCHVKYLHMMTIISKHQNDCAPHDKDNHTTDYLCEVESI